MSSWSGRVWWRDNPEAAPSWVTGRLDVRGGQVSLNPDDSADGENWIIPGLVDVHSHLSIGDGDNRPVGVEQARLAARTEIEHGVLAIREPGSPATLDPLAGFEGLAPVVIRSGQHLSRPKRYMRGLAIELQNQNDLPEAVAQQAAAGDGWVKLVGDWIDRENGAESDLDPVWDREILADAVQAAHQVGARVSVHAFSRNVIDDLLAANVDSIEHGSGMTAEHAQEAARRAITVTPTIVQVEKFPEFAAAAGNRYPRYAQTMMDLYENRYRWFESLIDAGVQLLPGSDAGGYQPHGQLAQELAKWVEYGLPPAETFGFATWKVRDYLGLESLWPKAAADFLVLGADPELNVAVLGEPREVIRSGKKI